MALLVMNVFWLMNRQLGWTIPTFGSLFALIGWLPFVLTFSFFAVLPLPGIVFASYLVRWHVTSQNAAYGYLKTPSHTSSK
jgi:hypothetical protein